MILKNDKTLEQLIADGGTYDINDTNAVTNMQFGGFSASDDTLFTTLKGVEANKTYANLQAIMDAEVDLKPFLFKSEAVTTLSGVPYKVRNAGKNYIITNVQLSAGKFHGYLLNDQMPAE